MTDPPRRQDDSLRASLAALLGVPEGHASAIRHAVWVLRLARVWRLMPADWDGLIMLEMRHGELHKLRTFPEQFDLPDGD